jgi:hypothetical protein
MARWKLQELPVIATDYVYGPRGKREQFPGFGGREVRVMRAFKGEHGSVVIEGVNLSSSQAELQSDAAVSRLMRLLESQQRPQNLALLVGYLPSPESINGEQVLVDWIKLKTGAKTFDLIKDRQQLQREAGDLVAQYSVGKTR